MQGIIGDLAPRDKPAKRAPLLRFDPYLDTVAWTFQTRWFAKEEWDRLVELYGGKFHDKHFKRLGLLRLSSQCPQKELIWECEELARKYDGNLARCDISNDVRPGSTDLDYIEQMALLYRMILLRERDKGELKIIPNSDGTFGTIWNYRPKGEKRPARDIVAYPDPISKLHGVPTGKFDLRLRYHALRRTMRAQGIGPHGKSLTEFDPSKAIRSHIRIVECDMQKEQQRYFQWLVQNQTDIETARRMIDYAKRFGQIDYVQRLRDQYPNCKVIDNWGRVSFSHSLSWGAVRRELQDEPSVKQMIKEFDDNDPDQ